MEGPVVLPLPRAMLARGDVVSRLVARFELRPRARDAMVGAYAFKDAELDFARALCALRTNLWLWRAHQQRFSGDFIIVDLSPPRPEDRPALAVELKRGRRVCVGRPGIQMINAPRALGVLARQGVVRRDAAPLFVTGDAWAVLREMPRLLESARRAPRSAA